MYLKNILLPSLAAILTVLGGVAPTIAKDNYVERLVVANNKMGSLSIIDPTRWTVEREIKFTRKDQKLTRENVDGFSGFADDVVVLSDGDTALISRPQIRDILALSLTTEKKLFSIPLDGKPDHFFLAPDESRLYVSLFNEACVAVIDIGKRKVIDCIPVMHGPHGVRISKDGKRGYVGGLFGDQFAVFDTETLKVTETHEFSEAIRPFMELPNENQFAIQLSKLHGFVIYDLTKKEILNTVHLPINNPAQNTWPHTAHHGVEISGAGDALCIAGTLSNYVAVLDYPTFERRNIVDVGIEPSWVINSPDGKTCYASARKGDSVHAIDYATGKRIADIPLGKGRYPQRMWSGLIKATQ